MDSYLRYCRDENAAERREQRRDQEARESSVLMGRDQCSDVSRVRGGG